MTAVIQRLTNSALARNAAWIFAGQGLSLIVQGLYFIVLARLLGTAEYGNLVGATAAVAIAGQYSSLGSGLIFLRYVSPDRSRFAEYWGNILLCTVSVGTFLVLILRFVGYKLLPHTDPSLLLVAAIADCLCGQLTTCAGQVFQAFERMGIMAALNLSINLARLILAISMMFFLHHATAYEWALGSLAVSSVAVCAGICAVTVNFGAPRLRTSLMFKRAAEGFVFAVSGSTTSVYNDVDKAMLSHYGMNVANGIYTMAYRVVDICTMPIRSIHLAAFPSFFRLGVGGARQTEPFARMILKRTRVFGALAALGMFIFAPIAPILIGKGFLQSTSALRWLCLIPLCRCFHLSAGDAIAGTGHQKFRLFCQAIAALSNFGLNLYFIPHYAWIGAAWTSLITDGGLGILNWVALFFLKHRARSEARTLAIGPQMAA